ncbi:histone family protein [Candidatus Woesearchaeota archaeon]|nr:histone family protein [Candidatus Woesearchaeota archaeon]
MKNTSIIPKAPVSRILFKAGAKRVSQPATDAFAEVLSEFAEDIARRSVQIARHSGRKTVKERDIKLAAK